MCKVLNAKYVGKHSAADRVYVGRPSKWCNPFVIGKDGTLMPSLHVLRNMSIICGCAPQACDADVLMALATDRP
jgi:hypothetical protein